MMKFGARRFKVFKEIFVITFFGLPGFKVHQQ
jgi:hypothetical protein